MEKKEIHILRLLQLHGKMEAKLRFIGTLVKQYVTAIILSPSDINKISRLTLNQFLDRYKRLIIFQRNQYSILYAVTIRTDQQHGEQILMDTHLPNMLAEYCARVAPSKEKPVLFTFSHYRPCYGVVRQQESYESIYSCALKICQTAAAHRYLKIVVGYQEYFYSPSSVIRNHNYEQEIKRSSILLVRLLDVGYIVKPYASLCDPPCDVYTDQLTLYPYEHSHNQGRQKHLNKKRCSARLLDYDFDAKRSYNMIGIRCKRKEHTRQMRQRYLIQTSNAGSYSTDYRY